MLLSISLPDKWVSGHNGVHEDDLFANDPVSKFPGSLLRTKQDAISASFVGYYTLSAV